MPEPTYPKDVDLLKGLPSDEVDRFFGMATLRDYQSGEAIVREGEVSGDIFLVASGLVCVEKETLEQEQEVLTSLGAGECFGELSLVDQEPRSATVRALGRTRVFAFEEQALAAYFASNPDVHRRILQNLSRIVSRRIRNLDETLIQSVYDSVIRMDPSGRVRQWKAFNSRAGLIEGDPETTIGKNLFELAPELGEGVKQTFNQVARSGKMAVLQVEFERGPDQMAYFEVTAAPRNDGKAGGELILGIRDVTESKALEKRMIQAEKLAMAGQMSAEIGHELKNYLTVLVGHTELLMSNPDIQKLERPTRSIRAISAQLDRVTQFSSGLMDLGMLRSKTEPSDLNTLITRLIGFIQGQKRFHQVSFEVDLDPGMPHLEVDPGQIQQVLLNLYTNAAEAMVSGRVMTTTRPTEEGAQVVVADDGPGMPEEVREHIFDSGYTTKDTGHGFGLAICHRIIENHKGSLLVDSAAGEGTTFTMSFQT